MPKDRVEAAIKRAMGKEMDNMEEVLYEGYAPHGVAVLVETATDNITRTVANVRACFNKGNGNLGTSGSVSFQFKKMGVFKLKTDGVSADDLELELIDHGLEELGEGTGEAQTLIVLHVAFNDFEICKENWNQNIIPLSLKWSGYRPTLFRFQKIMQDVLKLVDN
jgi:transcriptional/translational regulatory protein YebC/TACO1